MTYLVTGGAGFIGSNLVDKLLELNNKVIVLDNFSSGKEENLAQHKDNSNLTIYRKSICENLDDIFTNKEINAVFHLAAIPRVPFSIKYPLETHEVNINGTLNLLATCRKFNVKRFIFTSSSSIFGNQPTLPLVETMAPNPMSPYALHKLVGENYCKLYNFLYGLETISLRYFNVIGKRQDPNGEYACVIPRFIKLIKEGARPTINGDGMQTRDFTYVEDVARANILAAEIKEKKCFGETFNIGGGENHSINEITKLILELENSNIEPIHGPSVIEPHDTLADTTKAKVMLGWMPRVSFKEALKKTWEYLSNE